MSLEQFILRLLAAAAAGAFIGLQRELKDRPAGLRTHTLVAVGSCIYTLISFTAFPGSDPARVAANVAVGIGFIGAGTIIRQGSAVVGLTTAASLWVVAALGLAAGVGYLTFTAVATILVLLVLSAFKQAENLLGHKKYVEFEIASAARLSDKEFERTGEIDYIHETREEERYIYRVGLFIKEASQFDGVREAIDKLGEVRELKWQK